MEKQKSGMRNVIQSLRTGSVFAGTDCYAFYLQVNETKWLDLSPTGSQSLIFWSSVRTESDTSLWMLL